MNIPNKKNKKVNLQINIIKKFKTIWIKENRWSDDIIKSSHIKINKNPIDKTIYLDSNELNFISKCYCLNWNLDLIIINIPENITHVIFGGEFSNYDITKYLHKNITLIKFNSEYNNLVDSLPEKLINVQFGEKFNQTVNNLPMGLLRLQLGYNFNQLVDMLPESLEMLSFGASFNQDISNLPSNLKYIFFGKNFSYPIDSLPDTIHTIKFAPANSNFSCDILKLPSNIKKLQLSWLYHGNINGLEPGTTKKKNIVKYRYQENRRQNKLNWDLDENDGIDKEKMEEMLMYI